MSGNLPDGVSISDIPGNRPSDIRWEAWLDKIDYEAIAGAIVGQALDPLYAWFEREHNLAESFTDVVRNWLDALDTKVVGRIGAAFGCNPEPPE